MSTNLKRTATTAGLEPGPAKVQRTTRSTTRVGSAKETQTHTINGEKCRITVNVTSSQQQGEPAFLKTVHAQFTIRRENQRTVQLGILEGETIDKTYKNPGCDTPAWIRQLTPPNDYAGNLDTFALENDTVTDFQKNLMTFYTQKGEVRAKFKHLQEQLSTDKMHYICDFELKPAFHGCGLAQIVMSAYLTALGNLDNGHAFQGAVILSPAGIISATQAKEKSAKKELDWFEIREKLIKSYGRADYEAWHHAKKDLKFGMTIMGQVIPRPTANLPTSTMFPPAKSPAPTPPPTKLRVSRSELASLTINTPETSRTMAASPKSYYWHGRYYAITSDTDPAWIAEGLKHRRRTKPSTPTQKEFAVRAIIAESSTKYLIEWEGVDPKTGDWYADSWEPKANANAAAVADWEATKSKVVIGDEEDDDG
ncbi:hypothetical protein PRZ48_008974 [Zasmidium cellare]|uniref:Chromo domain-containing protein n=1 Tax=Zasmidium cellare TaxID=395010 RepID=A0ABR0EI78_ZASCE|nr:hypothetical protein PRZ48_008974 [Zasmidium cellare]